MTSTKKRGPRHVEAHAPDLDLRVVGAALFAGSLVLGAAVFAALFAPELCALVRAPVPPLLARPPDGASLPVAAVLCVPVLLVAAHLFWFFSAWAIYN